MNFATVTALNLIGFSIVYARCFPHCLSLIIVAFLTVFSVQFKFDTHLREIRSFVKAGGGSSRRALFKEWALSLSRMDFADTRWDSLLLATIYLVSKQSKYEVSVADKRLQRKADGGDESAAAAVAGPPQEPQLHWAALAEAVEATPAPSRGACLIV